MERELHYHNIHLIPQKSIVNSRKECDTSVKFGNYTFSMPICASNMKSVVNQETCLFFAQNNYFYIMHRFDIDVVAFIHFMHEKNFFASISIGVNEDSYLEIEQMLKHEAIPEFITLDVANAFCEKAALMIKSLKAAFPKSFIIAGNVATSAGLTFLENCGAHCVKLGIGNGLACTTKFKTGFSRPQVSSILDCVKVAKTQIIADGGILQNGDIVKGLAMGASMIMMGSMFAGFDESNGDLLQINGQLKKQYFGSASELNTGKHEHVEGKMILIDYKGSMGLWLKELSEDLKSGISYSGGKCVKDLVGTPMGFSF
jgi:GMP reductase